MLYLDCLNETLKFVDRKIRSLWLLEILLKVSATFKRFFSKLIDKF